MKSRRQWKIFQVNVSYMILKVVYTLLLFTCIQNMFPLLIVRVKIECEIFLYTYKHTQRKKIPFKLGHYHEQYCGQ